MIKIEIIAEDYYIADGMFDLARQIENEDLLDELYDGIEDKKVIEDEHYKAIITKE